MTEKKGKAWTRREGAVNTLLSLQRCSPVPTAKRGLKAEIRIWGREKATYRLGSSLDLHVASRRGATSPANMNDHAGVIFKMT